MSTTKSCSLSFNLLPLYFKDSAGMPHVSRSFILSDCCNRHQFVHLWFLMLCRSINEAVKYSTIHISRYIRRWSKCWANLFNAPPFAFKTGSPSRTERFLSSVVPRPRDVINPLYTYRLLYTRPLDTSLLFTIFDIHYVWYNQIHNFVPIRYQRSSFQTYTASNYSMHRRIPYLLMDATSSI